MLGQIDSKLDTLTDGQAHLKLLAEEDRKRIVNLEKDVIRTKLFGTFLAALAFSKDHIGPLMGILTGGHS